MFFIESSIYESYQSSSILRPNAFGTWLNFAFSSSMALLSESYQSSSSNACGARMPSVYGWILLLVPPWHYIAIRARPPTPESLRYTIHFSLFLLPIGTLVCLNDYMLLILWFRDYMYTKSQRTIVFHTLVICLFCTVSWNRWICFCLYFCKSQGCNKCY